MIERGARGTRAKKGSGRVCSTADTFAALKQTLISGGESESSPRECACTCRAMRDAGEGEEEEDRARMESMRSLYSARQKRLVRYSEQWPELILVADVRESLDSPSPSRRLYIHDDAARDTGSDELRARCINFPLSGSRRSLIRPFCASSFSRALLALIAALLPSSVLFASRFTSLVSPSRVSRRVGYSLYPRVMIFHFHFNSRSSFVRLSGAFDIGKVSWLTRETINHEAINHEYTLLRA